MTVEKNIAHLLRYDLVQLRGNSCSYRPLKEKLSKLSNFREKLQFVNSVRRLVFNENTINQMINQFISFNT